MIFCDDGNDVVLACCLQYHVYPGDGVAGDKYLSHTIG